MEKVIRATSVAIVIFVTVIAFAVGSRIDQNTISVLSGAVIGILVATPCAAIITFLLVHRKDQNGVSVYERQIRHSAPLPQNPPQYWVLPQQFAPMINPAYGNQALGAGTPGWQMQQNGVQALPRPRRRFYVIGESGEQKVVDEGAFSRDDVEDPYAYGGEDTGAAF
jgi:hypothetical protein